MKIYPVFSFLLFIALFTNSQKIFSQSFSDSSATQIDSLVSKYFRANKFSGSILVAVGGNVIIEKEYGFQNIDSSNKINQESVFEIASLSKQFTALLIMILKLEEKLDYDDSVGEYLSGFPYEKVTIRHLLTHTSGLSEREFFIWAGKNMDQTKTYNNAYILDYLVKEKPRLSFTPGEKWEYSNVGYFLLPLVIQERTGKQYIEYLKEKILIPLGMNSTGIFSQEIKGNYLDNYVFGKIFNPKNSTFISSFGMAKSDSIYGSVGILSNTTDLFKWDRALYTSKLVDRSTMQEAFIPYTLADGTSSNYGFGWFIKDDFSINGIYCGKRLDHYGLWPGYESSIVRYLDVDKTIILLSNQSPSAKDKLIEEISAILFEKIELKN